MGFCKGSNPEAGIEKAWLVKVWFDTSLNIVTGIISLLTIFLLYKKCQFKEVPLFVSLQMLLLLLKIPLDLSYHSS